MNAHQPRVTPSHGYDGTYSSFQSAGIPIFGYDASANRFAAFNLEALAGNAAKFCQFTGKERDAESGLDYFGARYYGSALGRFSSPDPLFFQKEMLEDPQRWNLYAYVRNSPLVLSDPTGEAIALSDDADERKKQLAALQKLAAGLKDIINNKTVADVSIQRGDAGFTNERGKTTNLDAESADGATVARGGQIHI